MFNYTFEYFFILLVLIGYVGGANQSALMIVVISECSWLLFFVQTHLTIKSLNLLELLAVLFALVAFASIDLGVVLSLVLFTSNATGSTDFFNFSVVRNLNRQFRSISEGAHLRVKRGFKA